MGDLVLDIETALMAVVAYTRMLRFLHGTYVRDWGAPASRYKKGVLLCATGHIHNFTMERQVNGDFVISADVRSKCRPSVEHKTVFTSSETALLSFSCTCAKAADVVDPRCSHLIALLVAVEMYKLNASDRPEHLRFPGFSRLSAQELTDRKLGWRDFTRSMLLPTPPRSIAGAIRGGYWVSIAEKRRLEDRSALIDSFDHVYSRESALESKSKEDLLDILRTFEVPATPAETKEALIAKFRAVFPDHVIRFCIGKRPASAASSAGPVEAGTVSSASSASNADVAVPVHDGAGRTPSRGSRARVPSRRGATRPRTPRGTSRGT